MSKLPDFIFQVLYKVFISFVDVGPQNVQTVDYVKGVGKLYHLIVVM